MRKFVFLFFLLITTGYTIWAQRNITFKGSADQSVVIGQQFQLVYSINAEGKDLRVDIPHFRELIGPNYSKAFSSSWDSNNGATSETVTRITYVLMAEKEGTFTIPPATIKVNNSTYKSNSVTIKVLPPDKESDDNTPPGLGKDDLFMRMIVSKTNVYEQEGFLVTFKYYARGEALIAKQNYPDFEGFLAHEIELPEPQWVMENYNDRNYRTAILKQFILFPQRSGNITIPGSDFEGLVRVRVQQRARNHFTDYYNTYRDVRKEMKTSPVTVNVKPLPTGRPAGFSGGVGNFTMKTSISSNQVKANEAITVKVNIEGAGNIRLIKNPEIIFPNDFEVYDPKVETNVNITQAGTTGYKTIEYLAIPRYGGDFEIPAITFSYFDPQSQTYKTQTSEPYKIHVEKGDGNGNTDNNPVVSNFTNRENVKVLGQDIRFLKVKGIHFLSREEMFFGSLSYILWYLIPTLLFIIFFVLYRKQIKENSDLARVRTKKANKMAVKRLKVAGKLLKENKEEEFYEEVLRASWGYLSDKLNIPQSNLTKENVESELIRYGVGETLINEFMDILNTCEFARYAPSRTSDAMDKLYQSTLDAIGKMESTIKK